MSVNLLPILPLWLIAPLAAALLGLLIYGSALLHHKRIPRRWIALLGLLRIAIIPVLIVCLLRPVISYSRQVTRDPALLVLIDSSLSMATPDAQNTPRLSSLLGQATSGDLAAHLRREFDVHYFTFDRDARPIDPGALTHLVPQGDSTDLSRALQSAATANPQIKNQKSKIKNSGPARILLLTDGNDHGQADPLALAQQLGLTIDVLIPPTSANPSSSPVRITSVQAARRVLLGSELRFSVSLRTTPSDGPQAATLTLLEDGRSVGAYPIQFAASEQERHLSFTHRPRDLGLRHYTFTLTSPDTPTSPDAQRDAADKSRLATSITVQVLGRQSEVLLLEDSWRWTFPYLRRVFEDDPSFNFTAFLPRGQRAFVQLAEPDRQVNLAGFPQSTGELAWFDVIVLGDVDVSRWPRALPASIHSLVAEHGKSLIIIAGPRLLQLARTPELASLLPVELGASSATPLEGPVEIRLTPDAARQSIFFDSRLATGRTQPAISTWEKLPPLDQIYPPLRKKPAASILLDTPGRGNDYGNLIVMAEHTVGRGRVLFIGTDTLWKWHMLGAMDGQTGQTPFTIFWQQALRALGPQRPGPAGAQLQVTPDRTRYTAGQSVTVTAHLRGARAESNSVLRGAVEWKLTEVSGDAQVGGKSDTPSPQPPNSPAASDNRLPLVFTPHATQPGLYTASFAAPVPGQYTIVTSLGAPAQSNATPSTSAAIEHITALDVEPLHAESDDTRVNAASLHRLARGTGGQVIDPADSSTWPAATPADRHATTESRSISLWDNFSLLILLSALLASDWLLRLLRGYV